MTLTLSPFQVQCPSCESTFPVDPDRVPPAGVYAICSVCERTFLVQLPEASESAEPEMADFDPPVSAGAAPIERADFDSSASAEVETDPTERVFTPPAPAGDEIDEIEWESEPPPPAEATEAPSEAPAPPDPGLENLSGLTAEALAEDDGESAEEVDAGAATLSLGAARFGRRDPHERARRLARVLVSDIIAYYPQKHAEAVERGTVKEDFEEEVRKSRKEYVDQVGAEIAESTPYFREALNEVLARGREVY